jgi:hypothetical protein
MLAQLTKMFIISQASLEQVKAPILIFKIELVLTIRG